MFTEAQLKKASEYWGKDVFTRIAHHAEIYSDKWKLTNVHFHDSYSMNAIFYCSSEIYGDCVLKIGSDDQDEEFVWEHNILQEYDGKGYIHLYESDIDLETRKKVMLIERVSPGDQLADEPSLDKRLAVFSELFNGLHQQPTNIEIYKKYADGLEGNVEQVSNCEDCKDLYEHILNAQAIFASIVATYPQEMLLHGDFQYHNILQKKDGTYAIVDPQGRIGSPVFDIPRYILIEYYNAEDDEQYEIINYIVDYFEKSLQIPSEIIRKCFYIETTSFVCWCASVGDYDIDTVLFAQTIMNNE